MNNPEQKLLTNRVFVPLALALALGSACAAEEISRQQAPTHITVEGQSSAGAIGDEAERLQIATEEADRHNANVLSSDKRKVDQDHVSDFIDTVMVPILWQTQANLEAASARTTENSATQVYALGRTLLDDGTGLYGYIVLDSEKEFNVTVELDPQNTIRHFSVQSLAPPDVKVMNSLPNADVRYDRQTDGSWKVEATIGTVFATSGELSAINCVTDDSYDCIYTERNEKPIQAAQFGMQAIEELSRSISI